MPVSPNSLRFAVAATLLVAGTACADSISITGSDGTSSFSGSVTVNAGTTTAQVIVQLTNTSTDNGYLTGFAFNNPESLIKGDIDKVTSFTTAPNVYPFALLGEVESGAKKGNVIGNSVSGSPYGAFDLGAALGNDLLGGGSPNQGIAKNQSATFTFNVQGAVWNLSAANILASLSTLPPGSTQANFLVRFKATGPTGQNSAKVLINGQTPIVPPAPVPAPPAVVLAGIGLASCFLGRLRRKTAA